MRKSTVKTLGVHTGEKNQFSIIFGKSIDKNSDFFSILESAFGKDVNVFKYNSFGIYQIVTNDNESIFLLNPKKIGMIKSIMIDLEVEDSVVNLVKNNEANVLWDVRDINYYLLKNIVEDIPIVNERLYVFSIDSESNRAVENYNLSLLLDETVKKWVVENNLDRYINTISLNVMPIMFKAYIKSPSGLVQIHPKNFTRFATTSVNPAHGDFFVIDAEVMSDTPDGKEAEVKNTFIKDYSQKVGSANALINMIKLNFSESKNMESYYDILNCPKVNSKFLSASSLKGFLEEYLVIELHGSLLDWNK